MSRKCRHIPESVQTRADAVYVATDGGRAALRR